MTQYSVDYLTRLRSAVVEFEEAFNAWMETQQESDHMSSRGLFPTVWTKEEGQDPARVRELELRVAEAAGAAAKAVAVTGAYIVVAGAGAIDPIANWSLMSAPRALIAPHDVRTTAANVRGRLASLLADTEAQAESSVPAFAPSQMHKVIWGAAADHWTTHQYRVAVREASEALTADWRARLGREDVDGTEFWQQTLSAGEPASGLPKLRWPGDVADKTTKSMRGGLEPLAKALSGLATGLNLTVRNVTTHTRRELSEQEALERLAAYSYLACMLDQCSVERYDESAAAGPAGGSTP